jgi:hypothetical protein
MNPRWALASTLLAATSLGGCMTTPERSPEPPAAAAPLVDVVTLVSCEELRGRIRSETDTRLVLEQEQGERSIPRKDITSIRRSLPASVETISARPLTEGRLVGSGTILDTFGLRPWVRQFHEVHSPVIETGVLRNIPFRSYQDESFQYELNIYGDPLHPASVEVGIYGSRSDTSKEELRNLMAGFLLHPDDRATLHQLSLDQDRRQREGLTFEVTPPDAPDAFGGWWLSIYDPCALKRARQRH